MQCGAEHHHQRLNLPELPLVRHPNENWSPRQASFHTVPSSGGSLPSLCLTVDLQTPAATKDDAHPRLHFRCATSSLHSTNLTSPSLPDINISTLPHRLPENNL